MEYNSGSNQVSNFKIGRACSHAVVIMSIIKFEGKRWQRTGNEQDKREYKKKGRQAKREVARAKRLAWESWSEELNSSEKQKEMFRITKQRQKERKDVIEAKYMKDEKGDINEGTEGRDTREVERLL